MESLQEKSQSDGDEGRGSGKTPSHEDTPRPQPVPQPCHDLVNSMSKESLINEPLRPALEALAELDRKDPKLAIQAARILGIYRRLWESCVSKHLECKEQAQRNQTLEESRLHLSNEREKLQHRYNEQLSHLRFFDNALHSSRERLTGILSDWKQGSNGEKAWVADEEKAK